MGLLDQILGGLTGNASGQSTMGRQTAGGGMGNALVALLPVVLSMLANRQGAGTGRAAFAGMGGAGGSGGLGGLIEQMTRSGYVSKPIPGWARARTSRFRRRHGRTCSVLIGLARSPHRPASAKSRRGPGFPTWYPRSSIA